MILIDPPTWPAHGTVFSHLISDSSLEELHDFATENHISLRAFDLDHYDVAAHRYDQLITAGAQAVSGSELTRRLIISGLRVPLKERPAKIHGTLLRRWNALLSGQKKLGKRLLDQWEEPSRRYHNSAHLLEMLEHLEKLYTPEAGPPTQPPRAVLLAAWFHDAIYRGQADDEQESARFATKHLEPLVRAQIMSVQELDAITYLIENTVSHTINTQLPEILTQDDAAYFFDADLAILAAGPARYRRYTQAIRAEYSRVPDDLFVAGRVAILQDFLGRESLFASERGEQLFNARARANMARELDELLGNSL